jgi:protein-disulfide isomerase
VLVAVAVVIAVGLASQSGDGDEGAVEVDGAAVQEAHICLSGRVPVDGATCGSKDAPVKIIEFSDYQCPWCKRFVDTTEVDLQREYIEAGLVQLEFHNFAILGGDAPPEQNESRLAAEAAECANEQGRYWQYHYKLFAEQRGENQGAFQAERLKQFASELGLDRDDFNRCLDSHKHSDLILEQQRAAWDAGVRGTPSFLINGELAEGFRTFEQLAPLIEAALQSTEGS